MSYQGKQYSCNPRAIYEYLDAHYEKMTFVWAVYKNVSVKESFESNRLVRVVPSSLSYFIRLITSEYVFTNIELPTYIPKKKNAIWVNTWHGGGAFKKVEHPSVNLYMKVTKKLQSTQTDWYISGSKIFTKIMSASTEIPHAKFLEIGMPRNDIFFVEEVQKKKVADSVRSFYKIKEDAFVVLYAPTFRGSVSNGEFDMELDISRIKRAFEARFEKKAVFLFRSHHAVKQNFLHSDDCIDVTSYPDMQHLLALADALITDYSSSIYDFALTRKPCFLFTPDLENYRKNRGLYTDIDSWAYPYAETNALLEQLILDFDENKSKQKIKMYLENIGTFDTGKATKSLMEVIKI